MVQTAQMLFASQHLCSADLLSIVLFSRCLILTKWNTQHFKSTFPYMANRLSMQYFMLKPSNASDYKQNKK